MITCGCCFEDVTPTDMVVMPDCAHSLCSECFSGYCKTKATAGQEAIQASCPDSTCNNIVPPSIFQKLLEAADFKKYESFLTKSFVDLSKELTWCPGKDCSMFFSATARTTIKCNCGS